MLKLIGRTISRGFSSCLHKMKIGFEYFQYKRFIAKSKKIVLASHNSFRSYGFSLGNKSLYEVAEKCAERGDYSICGMLAANLVAFDELACNAVLSKILLAEPGKEQRHAIRYLLERGTGTSITDGRKTALHIACLQSYHSSSENLKFHIADNDATIVAALFMRPFPHIQALLNILDEEGMTPAMMAAVRGNGAVLQVLYKQGASLAPRCRNGNSILDYLLQKYAICLEASPRNSTKQYFVKLVNDCLENAAKEGADVLEDLTKTACKHPLWLPSFAATAKRLFAPSNLAMALALNRRLDDEIKQGTPLVDKNLSRTIMALAAYSPQTAQFLPVGTNDTKRTETLAVFGLTRRTTQPQEEAKAVTSQTSIVNRKST